MEKLAEKSNSNNSILLARNVPVALVVGAASFLGSHLVDKLLSKNLQVIGVDDLTESSRDNLSKAITNKSFHLRVEEADKLNLDLDRLDYILIVPQKKLNLSKVLTLFRELKSRLLLISSIELYDQKESTENLHWLKKIESEIAKAAKEDHLNARILRLGSIYGPRMDFTSLSGESDPLIRLIRQSLSGDLQKDTSLEFSSRALYIDDAIDLAIKCIFAGATAQKIFDGASPTPIKVSEVKQVLLDPVWYESRDFIATPLPPWPTPNLNKTMQFLSWHPSQKIVSNLRETLSYFKDNEIKLPKLEADNLSRDQVSDSKTESVKNQKWKMEKTEELEGLKRIGDSKGKRGEIKSKNKGRSRILPFLILVFITYALLWPLFQLSWGILSFRSQLLTAIKSLEKGEFGHSLSSIRLANDGVSEAKSIFYSLESVRKFGIFKSQFDLGDNLSDLATLSTDSAQNTILGIQALYQSLKSITGESNESPKDSFEAAQTYLAAADEDLSRTSALINSQDFKSKLPKILASRISSLESRLSLYTSLVKKARALSSLMPEIVAMDGSRTYLVLLQNNSELRPAGGFIGSLAKISFETGKLKDLQVNDVYAIDGQLKIHVEPPKEIKNDLGQKDYFLRDSNWEPDFPTAARQAQWFYTKETGERVEGVAALDISAMESLLQSIGSLDLPDFNEKINAQNLFEKSVSHAEVDFFPGTQAKKSFLTALTQSLFNKLFFLPNQNWPGIVTSLGKSLEEKHMSIYLNDPKLFSYVVSQNWGSVLPRATSEKDKMFDFLAPVEANLGANKANYYLDRNYNLETVIGKDGEISHRLRIAYTNRSPSEAFPAGKYKNRMRVYLPFGTKLNRILWGESEITRDVTTFVDYGRAGFSFLIELLPKEQKTLVLDYQPPIKLDYQNNKASYRLDVIKQAGSLKDSFKWNVTYPINVHLSSDQDQKIAPQQYSIQTDLSTDKTFKLEFSRSLM